MPISCVRTLFPLLFVLFLAACGPSTPDPQTSSFASRAIAQEKQGIEVSVAVPTKAESKRYFGGNLAKADVQAVWLKIENHSDQPVRYLPISTDPDYFAPLEAAIRLHGWFTWSTNDAIDSNFERSYIPNFIPPHQTVSGFVYTHHETGLKLVNVHIVAADRNLLFRFVLRIEGTQYAIQKVDFEKLYSSSQIEDVALDALRQKLESLPCCVANKKGTADGDPLNLVIVGDSTDALFPFTEQGWQLNQPVDLESSYRMAKAFLFRSQYETAPVSPLYLFHRVQDVALQKARTTVSQRNHLRLWLAPFTCEGRRVWVGQISRDIGVKFTTSSIFLTTHRIGAQVDQERDYVLQDLLLTNFVSRFGYVSGVGESTPTHPRENLGGDRYYTDGLRIVIFLSADPHPWTQIQPLPWARPPLPVLPE